MTKKTSKKLTKQEKADFLFFSAFVIPIAFIGFVLGLFSRWFK